MVVFQDINLASVYVDIKYILNRRNSLKNNYKYLQYADVISYDADWHQT